MEHTGRYQFELEWHRGAAVRTVELLPQLFQEAPQARRALGGIGGVAYIAKAQERASVIHGQCLRDHAFLGVEVVEEHAVAGAQFPGQRAQGEARQSVAEHVRADAAQQVRSFGWVSRPRHEASSPVSDSS